MVMDDSVRGASLVVMLDGQTRTFDLEDESVILIGRERTCRLPIDHASISREHLRVRVEGGAVTVEELGSRNGTTLKGQRLEKGKRVPLEDGDSLEAGDAVITMRGVVRHRGERAPQLFPRSAADTPMGRALTEIDALSASRAFVLLMGEPGVGKTSLAIRLHQQGASLSGAPRPFVRVTSVDTLPAELDEELFGSGGEPGALETARGGTLFLDDLGEMPLATQDKLLQALAAQGIMPRLIAATHRNLDDLVARDAFRADLRVKIEREIVIPPIRERKSELAALAQIFLTEAADRLGRTTPSLGDEAKLLLADHKWPGNLRELRMSMERVMPLVRGDEVMAELLGLDPTQRTYSQAPIPAALSSTSLRTELDAFEKARVIAALDAVGGNQARAAELLGLPLRTFVKRLTRFGLTKPRRK